MDLLSCLLAEPSVWATDCPLLWTTLYVHTRLSALISVWRQRRQWNAAHFWFGSGGFNKLPFLEKCLQWHQTDCLSRSQRFFGGFRVQGCFSLVTLSLCVGSRGPLTFTRATASISLSLVYLGIHLKEVYPRILIKFTLMLSKVQSNPHYKKERMHLY